MRDLTGFHTEAGRLLNDLSQVLDGPEHDRMVQDVVSVYWDLVSAWNAETKARKAARVAEGDT